MKEYLSELVRSSPTPALGHNLAREYLQARILGALQRAGAMVPPVLALGGLACAGTASTALRLVEISQRATSWTSRYDLRGVHSAFIRFSGLLYDLALSPQRDQVLAVKIEVDTHPPAGAGLATTVIRRHVTLQLQHHDRASLLAGKLHAVLQRPYLKGRDLYDLLWYLSDPDWPLPNLVMLNNALQQTGWTGERLTQDNWRPLVRERLTGASWDQVVADVHPFLGPGAALELLTLDNLLRVLGQGASPP